MATPIATTRDAKLSRWQSAVEKALRQENPNRHISEIRRTPQIQGLYQHVQAASKGETIPQPKVEDHNSVEFNAYTSQQFYAAISKLDTNITYTPEIVLSSVDDWPYSTDNVHNWIGQAISQYGRELFKDKQYRDPVDSNGNYDKNKSLIQWKLPSTGKVIILGDWGTSCLDAQELLRLLLLECGSTPPACIIHLGDIYYSGTQDECDNNFYNVIRTNLGYTGPVFTIPGNHEYYDFGDGFYYLIDKMNTGISGATQAASYFCLRTADNKWQFLGLDTGYNDGDNATTYFAPPAPDLKSNLDQSWAEDKLMHFPGKTIMLTHHQLFTRSAEQMHSGPFGGSCANPYLYSYFSNYFNKIAAWYWGHEHSFALFQNGLMGLNMGRLVGSSSYEEAISDDPYAINYPLIPYNSNNVVVQPNAYKPDSHDSNFYYPHVGAILELKGGDTDPTITYYSLPSWDKEYLEPQNFHLTSLCTESITSPASYPTGVWDKNDSKSYNSDYGPAVAGIGDAMYIAYQNKDDSGKIYWDNASFDGSALHKNNPTAINSSVKTDQNPAMVNLNGKLLLVYKLKGSTDLYYCTFDPGTGSWTSHGRIEDNISTSPNVQSNYGPSLTVFNGKAYLLFLDSSDNSTVNWGTFNGSSWSYHASKNVGGSVLKSYNHVCPALTANSTSLFITVANSNKTLTFITGDTNDNWTSRGVIANNYDNSDNLPKTQKALGMTAYDHYVEVFYVDDDGYICWALCDLNNNNLWTGGIRTIVSPGSLPQTSQVPAVWHGTYRTLLLYRGNSNHNLYYSSRYLPE